MNDTEESKADVLNEIGLAFLVKLDTRFVIIAAFIIVILFGLALWLTKKRFTSRDEAISLGHAFLNLYSAPVLFCLLVLTKPPAVGYVSDFLRQSAGLIASLFLGAGVLKQIWKIWTDDPENSQHQFLPTTAGKLSSPSSAPSTSAENLAAQPHAPADPSAIRPPDGRA